MENLYEKIWKEIGELGSPVKLQICHETTQFPQYFISPEARLVMHNLHKNKMQKPGHRLPTA